MVSIAYFHASDDRTDFFRRVGTDPVEQAGLCVDGHFEWFPVPDNYLTSWGIELVHLPGVKNEAGLRLAA